jgi:hypothetical protein
VPPQLDIAEKTVWMAEPAAMTPEEEKLFEQPAANWGDLAQMVEQSAAEPAAPPPLPWQMPAETAPELELMEVAPDSEFLPDALLEAPLAEIPVGQDALLQTAETTVAQTATESELESYENLTDTVRAQGPIRTMAAPRPDPPAAADPEPPKAPPLDASAEATPPEAASESAPPPSQPAWSGPVEELEAAPAERNITPAEAFAEAAPAAVDPATLEHLIRGVVGELMPQIIDQVKQALKR